MSKKLAKVSDSGGVAARLGFKYQDHVAAQCIIKMISDGGILQVECETSDDVTIIWSQDGVPYPEYVQVKTTEKNSKWNQTEICGQADGKAQSSIIEKSLLCDKNEANAKFRIVSKRDLNDGIACLKLELTQREKNKDVELLAEKLGKKFKNSISQNGNKMDYWVRNAVWQVAGDIDALATRNQLLLSKLAENYGVNTSVSHFLEIYKSLLEIVSEAAVASKVTSPEKKIVKRGDALTWWKAQLDKAEIAILETAKPYKVTTEGFFAELHNLSESQIKKALASYDARYEGQKWRSTQLAEYLSGWLPEFVLKASELVMPNHNYKARLRSAIKKVEVHKNIDVETILAEIMLHAILRHHFYSEPIACKIFYKSGQDTKIFGNAHIVRTSGKDELWLGQAKLIIADDKNQILQAAINGLQEVLDPDFLKEEREVILALREPKHLLPTTLEEALAKYTPIDDLLASLCITLLVAYDSDSLKSGFSSAYQDKLRDEVSKKYEEIKVSLPDSITMMKVHIILIPIECNNTLISQFKKEVFGVAA